MAGPGAAGASRLARQAQPEAAALFISDLHLQADMPGTAGLFLSFLERHARHARSLYLLGDLFEYWAGDDDIPLPFHAGIVGAIRAVSDAGVAVYWIAGNRDFLVGAEFAQAAGLALLADPHVTHIAGRRIVLSHGDAQCSDDLDYQAFRRQVRDPAWQQGFLAQSLGERRAIIEGMRAGSRAAQRGKTMAIMDVNPAAIDKLFAASGAELMIHGHTHRPGLHRHDGKLRYVLPDWDGDADPPRGGWLEMDADGMMHRHDALGRLVPI